MQLSWNSTTEFRGVCRRVDARTEHGLNSLSHWIALSTTTTSPISLYCLMDSGTRLTTFKSKTNASAKNQSSTHVPSHFRLGNQLPIQEIRRLTKTTILKRTNAIAQDATTPTAKRRALQPRNRTRRGREQHGIGECAGKIRPRVGRLMRR